MLRFAPSTTQDIGLNSLKFALFNYILSKQKNEDLVIRIEDIDKQNSIDGKDKEILELLALFSIEYKNVVYQSDNLKYHQKIAMQLMGQKNAFACFCSEEKLDQLKSEADKKNKIYSYDGFCSTLSDETVLNCNAPFTVRIKKPDNSISFKDEIKGELTYSPDEIDYFRILNHDKTPTYNYACAVDDMLFNTTLVIRDETFLEDTPRQIYIRNLLNYDMNIEYIHLPLIKNEITIKSLIDDGFLPAAIANYLVLLTMETEKEIFTLEEAISWFDIRKISNSNLVFDIEKLKEINKKHLEAIDELRLSKILGFADSDIGKLAKLYLSEISTLNEMKSKIDNIFSEKSDSNQLKEKLKNAPYFENLDDLIKYLLDKSNLSQKELTNSLKLLLTNEENGIDLKKIYPLIKNYLGEIVK